MKLDKSGNANLEEPQARETRMSSLAILALILSVASIPLVCCGAVPPLVVHGLVPYFVIPFMPIPAIVLGCIALIAIKRSEGKLRGKAIAVIGLAISFTWMGIWSALIHATRGKIETIYGIKQKAQLFNIDTAIELFNSEFGAYPASDALDQDGRPYCGAMKLCEAMMGKDLMGVHPKSVLRSDGTDREGKVLYPDSNSLSAEAYKANLSIRKGPYLPPENAGAYRLKDLYKDVGPFDGNDYVICDTYKPIVHITTGKKIGMPVLYYRADTSKTAHDVNDPNNPENIYNYRDNHALLALGVPGKPGQKHPLYEDPRVFYEMTKDYKISTLSKPYRAETYILLSAGWDGLYGTKDDIPNFELRWKRE